MKGESLDWESVLRPAVDGNIGDRVLMGLTSKPSPFSKDEEYWVLLDSCQSMAKLTTSNCKHKKVIQNFH